MPRLGNDTGPVSRTDLFLIPLNQEIERCGIDIAFFKKNSFEGTHAQFRLGPFGMFMIVRHGVNLAEPSFAGKQLVRCRAQRAENRGYLPLAAMALCPNLGD